MLIDRAATFRGKIIDHGVSKSSGGFMQWTAELLAMEIWDVDEGTWVDWTDYGDEYGDEIKSYNILFGGNEKPTLSCQQVKAITGWEGTSFAALGAMDLTETLIQFRTEWNTYQEKTNLQVEWIDVYDATPGRSVKKLNAAELKSLDAEFSKMLKQSGATKAPVKAGNVKAGTVTKKGVSPTQNKGPVTKTSKKKDAKVTNPIEAPVEETAAAPPGPPTAPSTVAKAAENAVSGSCTKDEAWGAVQDLKKAGMGDEQIANTWLGAIKNVAPGVEQEDVTNEQWWVVRTKVLDQVSGV